LADKQNYGKTGGKRDGERSRGRERWEGCGAVPRRVSTRRLTKEFGEKFAKAKGIEIAGRRRRGKGRREKIGKRSKSR